MSAGIGLCLIATFIWIFVIAIHPLTRRITNTYLFFIIVGIIGFGYFIGACWIPNLIELCQQVSAGFYDPEPLHTNAATLLSKVLLLDICPATSFTLSLFCIVNRKRNISIIIAPISLFGALLTIYGGLTDIDKYHAEWTAQFIFVGYPEDRGYFMVHFLNIIIATLVLLNAPKTTVYKYPYMFIAGAIFFCYVGICIAISHSVNPKPTDPNDHNNLWIYQNTAGVLLYDWDANRDGEFKGIMEALGSSPAVAMCAGYAFFIVLISIAAFLPSLLQLSKYYRVENKYCNSKNKIFGVYQLPNIKKQVKRANK